MEQLDPLEVEIWRARRRGHRIRLGLLVTAVLAVAALLILRRCGIHVAPWIRGETDLHGHPRWTAPHPVDPAALSRVDLERVHRELFPDWMIAQAHGEPSAARRTFSALRREAGQDLNLRSILE